MKTTLAFLIAVAGLLGGCVAVPVEPGPVYAAPAPVYAAPPVVVVRPYGYYGYYYGGGRYWRRGWR